MIVIAVTNNYDYFQGLKLRTFQSKAMLIHYLTDWRLTALYSLHFSLHLS